MKEPSQLMKIKGVNESFKYSGGNLNGIFDKTPIVVLEKNIFYLLKNGYSINNNNNNIKLKSKLIKEKQSLNKMSLNIKKNKLNKKPSTLSINNELSTLDNTKYLIQLQDNDEIEMTYLSKNFNVYIKKIINDPIKTIVQNDVDDKMIKMVVNMKNGKQKLVQFELIGNCTTISDLLEYSEIPYTNKTKIYFVNDKILNINYVVDTYEDNIASIENTLYNNNYETINCPNCDKIIDNINECNECNEKYLYDVRLIPKNLPNSQKKIIMSVAENFYNNNDINKNDNINIKTVKNYRKIEKYNFNKKKIINDTSIINNNENNKKINDKNDDNNNNNDKIINDDKNIINDGKNNNNSNLTDEKIGVNLADRLRRIRKKKVIIDY